MFAEKPLLSTSDSSNLHLPPIRKNLRHRRHRPPLTPSYSSTASKTAHIAENVSALKAKYTDYTAWLKTSTKHNREPVLTQELLKHSLCQMGIDSGKAEQLVSTCSWYVYQFQKDLKTDPEQRDQLIAIETKKQEEEQQQQQQQSKKKRRNKSNKTTPTIREHSGQSAATATSLNKEDTHSFNPLPPIRNNYSVLPTIHISDLSTSSRSRHVDFNNEETKNPIRDLQSPHWRSALFKTRAITKLHSISTEPPSDPIPTDNLDLSASQQSLRRNGVVAGHTRSILRKQPSSCSSVTSAEASSRKNRNRILTLSSNGLDEIPLGTRSQRLFGGSECFAQIMNELEEQQEE